MFEKALTLDNGFIMAKDNLARSIAKEQGKDFNTNKYNKKSYHSC